MPLHRSMRLNPTAKVLSLVGHYSGISEDIYLLHPECADKTASNRRASTCFGGYGYKLV